MLQGLRGVVVASGIIAALASAASVATAQSGRTPERLFVRPKQGDTLNLQMEQVLVVRPARSLLATGSAEPGVVSRFLLYAHSIVEKSGVESMLTVSSDSLKTWMAGPGDPGIVEWQPIPEPARLIRVRVAEDGAMRVNDDALEAGVLTSALPTWIPGLLSGKPVRAGSEWTRTIELPSIRIGPYTAAVSAIMNMRLDSLSQGGQYAWISMRGRLVQARPPLRQMTDTAHVDGAVTGFMVLDRRRAWVTSASTQFSITMELPVNTLDIRVVQQVRVR